MKTPIKTRLELTLCAMLPYELKGTIYYQEDNSEEITLGYKDEQDNVVGIDSWVEESTYKILPHLHSLEKLIDTDDYFTKLEIELCEILETVYSENFIKSILNNRKYVIDTNKTIEAMEWLSANHFNIYGLSKEMYIEKSDSVKEPIQISETPTVKTKKGKIGDYVEIWNLGGLAATIDKITVDGYILTNEDGVVPGYFGDDDLAINPYGEEELNKLKNKNDEMDNTDYKLKTPETIIQELAAHLGKTIPETLEHIKKFEEELNKLKNKNDEMG